jgi:hypothetical protein
MAAATNLSVVVDGVPMAEPEARAFWARFSAHMEAHKGDLAGFAKAEGFASVKPTLGPTGPQLAVSRTATQAPYANAKPSGGSKPGSPRPQAGAGKTRKNAQKRR